MLYGAKPLLAAVDVLVVGGGPTGLTAASLLTTYELSVALIEKNQTTSDEAKAISLDDESLRTLQAAGHSLDRNSSSIARSRSGCANGFLNG